MHDRCMVTRSRSSGVDSRVGIDYRHRGACCASRRKEDMDMQATGAAEAVVASYRDTVMACVAVMEMQSRASSEAFWCRIPEAACSEKGKGNIGAEAASKVASAPGP